MNAAHPVGPTSGTWAQIRPPGAAQGPPGLPKGPFWAKTGPFGGPGSAVEVYYRARAHDMNAAHPVAQLDQPVALGPKLGPPGLPRALRGSQRGLSGPKRALLGAPGVP